MHFGIVIYIHRVLSRRNILTAIIEESKQFQYILTIRIVGFTAAETPPAYRSETRPERPIRTLPARLRMASVTSRSWLVCV